MLRWRSRSCCAPPRRRVIRSDNGVVCGKGSKRPSIGGGHEIPPLGQLGEVPRTVYCKGKCRVGGFGCALGMVRWMFEG